MAQAVDVVIPVYGERPDALAATLNACLQQSHPVGHIYVVDDGSPQPVVLPDLPLAAVHVQLIRLAENLGISAARNAAIAQSDAPLIACINAEVVPDPDWLATCVEYISNRGHLGACYTRIVSATPRRLLSRWRMRFFELKFGAESGPTPFAVGHAVLFRRAAIDSVGGYNPQLRLHHEDSDICFRMRAAGWETHYIAKSKCVSSQVDSLPLLTRKIMRDVGWYSPESSLARLYMSHTKMTCIRAGRNLVKARFDFLPVDAVIWICGLWIATSRTLQFRFVGGKTKGKSVAKQSEAPAQPVRTRES